MMDRPERITMRWTGKTDAAYGHTGLPLDLAPTPPRLPLLWMAAAFALTLLANLNPRRFAVQSLVLCPTRELADQVATEIRRLARAEENIKVVVLCGGVPLRNQTASLENGAHIVVGTPGRIMDHLARGNLTLEALNTLVLDEADRMLDMGFFEDIVTVAKQCPKERQTLLFSATYPEGIAKLSQQFMKAPQTITVQAQHEKTKIQQRWYQVPDSDHDEARLGAVAQVLRHFRPASTLAFCNTKSQCRALVAYLKEQGFSALALFGELEQRERDQVLVQFSNRSCSVLVATDVAARGIDVVKVSHVINFDVPSLYDDYVHRIGRTGRALELGKAITFATKAELFRIGKIEELIRAKIPVQKLPNSIVVEETPVEEAREMSREIDRWKRRNDPEYGGAFHERKRKKAI